jgi:short subunit dehydrogenase-like uncharacterized protein
VLFQAISMLKRTLFTKIDVNIIYLGEVIWVRSIIDKYHEEAEKKGTFIVPFCGFDSIPSDLGTYMVVDYMHNKLNKDCDKVNTYFVQQ